MREHQRGRSARLRRIGVAGRFTQVRQKAQLDHLRQHPQGPGALCVGEEVVRGPLRVGDGLVSAALMSEHDRLSGRRGKGDGARVGRGRPVLPGGQGAKCGGRDLHRLIHGGVANDHDLDRPLGDAGPKQRLEVVRRAGGRIARTGEGETKVSGMHQLAEVALQDAGRRGRHLVVECGDVGLHPDEWIGPEARLLGEGGQQLHLDRQVLGPRRPLQGEGVLAGGIINPDDVGRQDLLHLFRAELLQPAFDEGAASGPGRGDLILRQI